LIRLALTVVLLLPAIAMAQDVSPIPREDRRSDAVTMTPALRAMQADDFANPAMLAVAEGEALWATKTGLAARSCADCHGAPAMMRGVAARYPAWDAARRAALDLSARVEQCRTERQQAPALPHEDPARLALTALIALQSRGLPIAPSQGADMDAVRARGHTLFTARTGQLNLSCAQCHDGNWGRSLGAALIPQAHPVAYPIFRLEWQGVGSLQRRLRNCLAGVRAEPFAYDAPEMVALEAFLMDRSADLTLEAPGVRP
jgi:sulfur-oxidizing protein SoxA